MLAWTVALHSCSERLNTRPCDTGRREAAIVASGPILFAEMLEPAAATIALLGAATSAATMWGTMTDWLGDHRIKLLLIGAGSLVMLVGGLLAARWFVTRLPPDFLTQRRRPRRRIEFGRSLWQSVVIVAKNVVGYICVIAGLAMLVLPGPGLLVLLIGFLMVDFPGKFRLERWILSRRRVLDLINRTRRRYGAPPLDLPTPTGPGHPPARGG